MSDYINLLNEKILKDVIYATLGKETTYLNQLEQFGKSLLKKKFKGCYPSDQIPKLTNETPYCIFNLDSANQNGSHWIGVCKDGDTVARHPYGFRGTSRRQSLRRGDTPDELIKK